MEFRGLYRNIVMVWIHFFIFLSVEIGGYVYPASGSQVLHNSYCSNFPIGRLLLGCHDGFMVSISDSVIYARDDATVRLKALGNHKNCDHASRCVVTFQTYHSGWQWLNCLNVTYMCIPALCRPLRKPVFGSLAVNRYSPGGEVRYRCDHGYMLNGPEVSKCTHHDNHYFWYPDPPTCEYNCRNLVLSPHPVGAYMSMCFEFVMIKRSWDDARAYCVRNNGNLITYESMDFFETAFDAQPAIKLPGRTTWGTFWTSSEEYRPRYCKILNVNVLKTVDHYTRWMTCDRKYYSICEYVPVHPKRCSPLSIPENGAKTFSNESIGAVVSFTCNEGYTINGTANRRCLSSGMWSGEEPRCILVNCGKPDIRNGSVAVTVTFSQTTYLSFANYSCDDGHVLMGDAVRICTGNGTWSGKTPECAVITSSTTTTEATTTTETLDCGEPVLRNSSDVMAVEMNSTLYLSLVIYRCIKNTILVGDSIQMCTENGTWNGTAPVCQPTRKSEFAGYTTKSEVSSKFPTVVVVILVVSLIFIIIAAVIITLFLYKRGKFTVCFHRTKGYPTESINNPTYMEVDTRDAVVHTDLSYSVLTENEETIYEEIPGDRTL